MAFTFTPGFNAKPVGWQRITSVSSSTALTAPANSTSPNACIIQPESQPIRITDDGTTPTSTVGLLIPVGEKYEYNGDLSRLRMIETAASATVNVQYYEVSPR